MDERIIKYLNEYADGLRHSGKTKEADAVRKSITYINQKLEEDK
jgi:hypothetical protein